MNTRRLGNLTLMRAIEVVTPFDPAVFFPETAPEEWEPHEAWLKPHAMDPESGLLLLYMQSYIVRTSRHTILVDTCVGNHKERPNRPAWHQKTDDTYINALRQHGIAPEDIDYVMCTHLHSDHVGWNTKLVDGNWVPTFPNARYVFSEKEYKAWESGADPRFPDAPFRDSVLPIVEAGRAELVGNDHALDDEVWLEPTPGHTPDHVAIRFASEGESAVMSGDLMHCPVQCKHPEWTAWPDFDANLAKVTRRAFLEKYCETDTLVCTAHFPPPSAGRIAREGNGFRFEFDDSQW